jgi:hypothetical protein
MTIRHHPTSHEEAPAPDPRVPAEVPRDEDEACMMTKDAPHPMFHNVEKEVLAVGTPHRLHREPNITTSSPPSHHHLHQMRQSWTHASTEAESWGPGHRQRNNHSDRPRHAHQVSQSNKRRTPKGNVDGRPVEQIPNNGNDPRATLPMTTQTTNNISAEPPHTPESLHPGPLPHLVGKHHEAKHTRDTRKHLPYPTSL